MIQRLKNLWYLSGLPKDSKGYPDEYERGFNNGEMHAITSRDFGKATVVPYKTRDPVKEIIGEKEEIV